ncbi:hypothetical protein ALC53_10177, partial [Atta colombica]
LVFFYVANNNAREAAHQYRDRYPDRRHPDHKAILHLTTRARMGLMKRKHVIMNPHINQCQISCELNVSPATVYRIVHDNHIHSYHITLNQEFSDNVMFSNESAFESNDMLIGIIAIIFRYQSTPGSSSINIDGK